MKTVTLTKLSQTCGTLKWEVRVVSHDREERSLRRRFETFDAALAWAKDYVAAPVTRHHGP